MNAEPLVVLDEQTIEEMQPPCDASDPYPSGRCDDPAEWVIDIECENCEHVFRNLLHCTRHKDVFAANKRTQCSKCKKTDCLRVTKAERL
jgi:hypothetical protein